MIRRVADPAAWLALKVGKVNVELFSLTGDLIMKAKLAERGTIWMPVFVAPSVDEYGGTLYRRIA
jgi:hypothetical protein